MKNIGTLQILYLGGNGSNSLILEKTIRDAGYMLEIAHGCQGVELATNVSYAVIIIDQTKVEASSKCNELHLLRSLIAKGVSTPVVLLAGANDTEVITEFYQLGIEQILFKDGAETYLEHLPFVIEQIVKRNQIALELAQEIDILHLHNKELKTQVADLDAYADTVAHDLKNPITHFLSYADDLRENYDRMSFAEIEGHLDVIVQQSNRMNNMIEELLLLARARLMKEIETEPLNMKAILTEALSRLQNEIEEYQGQIILPESWPTAIGYRPWMEEVWVNYLSNGLKYGGNAPKLHIGADQQADGMIRFWVQDQGDGLTPDDQAQLFKPFPRLDHPKKQGNGLGLAIVRHIIERLNGQVSVQSKVGQGSVFYFTLPSCHSHSKYQ